MMHTLFNRLNKPKLVADTPLSRFVHSATSAEKKSVYNKVIRQASEEQRVVLKTYLARRSSS